MRVCKSCIWFGDCAERFQSKEGDKACEYFTMEDLTPVYLNEYKASLKERATDYRMIVEEMGD